MKYIPGIRLTELKMSLTTLLHVQAHIRSSAQTAAPRGNFVTLLCRANMGFLQVLYSGRYHPCPYSRRFALHCPTHVLQLTDVFVPTQCPWIWMRLMHNFVSYHKALKSNETNHLCVLHCQLVVGPQARTKESQPPSHCSLTVQCRQLPWRDWKFPGIITIHFSMASHSEDLDVHSSAQ